MNRGQSLIEVLVGVAVGAILIGGVAATIAVSLRSNVQNKNLQIASSLAQETINDLTDFAAANWHNIDALTPGLAYHLATSGAAFTAAAGPETFAVDGVDFSRSFIYENVSRDPGTDAVEEIYNPNNDDPSTKRLVVTVGWKEGESDADTELAKIITRSGNLVIVQTNWSGAAGQAGPITEPNNRYDSKGGNLNAADVPGSIKVEGF